MTSKHQNLWDKEWEKRYDETYNSYYEKQYEKYFFLAAEIAKQATCERSKCGCVIAKN